MLKLYAPFEGIRITLPIDDPVSGTGFWIRPMTEREASAMRHEVGDNPNTPETESKLRQFVLAQIYAIDNVSYRGNVIVRTDDLGLIKEILDAIPAKAMNVLAALGMDACLLSGKFEKNSDGSSGLLVQGSVPVPPASIEGASDAGANS